jgi:hypothetical protein
MKKLPFYLRLGFAIMGVDPYAKAPAATEGETTSQIAQNQKTDSRSQIAWISVKDKLPPLYKPVVIYTTDGETLHNWARVNDGHQDYYIHSTDDKNIYNVTHWMDVGTPIKIQTPLYGTTDPKKPHLPVR